MSKVAVTDELLDAYVNRPLAAYVVRAVVATPVTPNQLTLVSAMFGTVGAMCMALDYPFAPLAGAVALFLCMVFDCSDGQLARARGGGSVVGRIFDGYADYWVAICLHLGILIGFIRHGVVVLGHAFTAFECFLLVLAAGLSVGITSGRFDYYKQRFLAHTGAAREPESPDMFLAEAARTDSLIAWAALRLFAAYVRVQQGPVFRAAAVAARVTAADPAKVAKFTRENSRLLRLWGLSGPTMHNGLICAAACFVPVVPQALAYYCVFAIVVVNLYCVVLRVLQRRVLAREHVWA